VHRDDRQAGESGTIGRWAGHTHAPASSAFGSSQSLLLGNYSAYARGGASVASVGVSPACPGDGVLWKRSYAEEPRC
jgi:hypothetical protein